MKTLILIRHAKSGWDNISQSDFERTLNQSGRRDAREMARKLAHRGVQPGIFLSSPAFRTLETAEFFRKEFQMSKNDIQVIPFLYEPTLQAFYDAIEPIESKHDTALVFSHNPGITRLVHELESEAFYDMPPCGMVGIQLLSDQWNELRIAEKNFMFFDFPERS